jgi:dihydrolipoamide dehydrogenase
MPKAFDLGNPRVMTSTEALEVEDIPENLLVVGGGYIGMELGTVYAALGSKIHAGRGAGQHSRRRRSGSRAARRGERQKGVQGNPAQGARDQNGTAGKQIKVEMEYNGQKARGLYDRVLVAVGRVPNSADLGLENTKVTLDERVSSRSTTSSRRTTRHLRHRRHRGRHPAGAQGAQGGAHRRRKHHGEDTVFESVIPAVVFTDPELAWCGLTEAEAKEKGVKYEVAKFPWSASGRALSFDRTDGVTKMID